MATIKNCTDLEQSRKLSEFLSIESADMHYNNVSIKGINYVDEHRAELMDYITAKTVLSKYMINPLFEVIPCWSLAALLNVLPYPTLYQQRDGAWGLDVWVEQVKPYSVKNAICEVDACYEMILKLHKQNVL